jgi:ABC-type amino acid transport substrate-binding protein
MHHLVLFTLGLLAAGAWGTDTCDRDRTWLLAIEHDWAAYAYVDEEGFMDGFSEDIARMVCEAAGVKCEIMYDSWTNCVDSSPGGHPVLGLGLKARMYDACVSALPTVERAHFARFSVPYSKAATVKMFGPPGSSPITDFTDKKIGFVDGWYSNEKCLARCFPNTQGVPLKADQIVYKTGPQDLKPALENGEVDGFLVTSEDYKDDVAAGNLVEHQTCQCVLGDVSVIARKDGEFPDVFNEGFAKIVLNGQYKRLCEKWGESNPFRLTDENGHIDCLPYYNISDFNTLRPHWLKK